MLMRGARFPLSCCCCAHFAVLEPASDRSWFLADYDAVLTEAGDYMAKYCKLRDFFGTVLGTQKAAAPGTTFGLTCSETFDESPAPSPISIPGDLFTDILGKGRRAL